MYASTVEIDITPPVGAAMDGYAARAGNSLGIHDPLLGQLLLLDSGEKQLLIICLDLLGVSLEFTGQVRQGIAQATDIPADCILLACSHTHSGASGFLPRLPGIPSIPDAELKQMLFRKLVGAAQWATRRLEPARLGIGRGSVTGIGLNRNQPEAGSIDDEVIVLQVEAESSAPLAVLINYGCHPTVLGYDNRLYSADFPGATRAALQRIYPETTFLFTNGAAGDISTRFTRRDQSFREVERLGRLLAGEVLKVMQTIQTPASADLEARVIEVELTFRPFPSREEAQQELARRKAELEQLRATIGTQNEASHGEIRKAMTRMEGATGQALMVDDLAGRAFIRSQMQVLRIADLGLVGMPGEVFTHTALEIKASRPDAITAVVSYANDYQGYFPDAQSYEEESYEALISPFGVEVEERLRRGAVNVLEQLWTVTSPHLQRRA